MNKLKLSEPCIVSFYDEKTGVFSGRRFQGPRLYIEKNTPAGFRAMEGRYNRRSQRVDVETGQIIDYTPPDEDDPRRRKKNALIRIAALERRQYRSVREVALDPSNNEARNRLQQIDSEIERLRADLQS